MLTLFRGMVGDIEYDQIYNAEKQVGPFLYMVYLSTTAFVAFNILIAVISDSYDSVKDLPAREGVTVSAWRFVQRKFYKTTGIQEEKQEKDDDTSEQLASLVESVENLTHMIGSLHLLHEQSQERLKAVEEVMNPLIQSKAMDEQPSTTIANCNITHQDHVTSI